MKKILVLLLVAVMTLSVALVSCGNTETPANESKNNDTPVNEQSNANESKADDNGETGNNEGNGDKTGEDTDSVLDMPNSFVLESMISASTIPFVLYRIGDEYMSVHNRDLLYSVKIGDDSYKSYYGEIEDGKAVWEEDTDVISLYHVYSGSEMGNAAERLDPNSYCRKYCTKKDNTVELLGVKCVEYSDDGFTYYFDEETGLCFKYMIGSSEAEYLTRFEKSCDAFPYDKPAA